MTKRMITAQLSVWALLLVLVALMESYTGWDTAAQRLWFDSATHEWVGSNELHARLTWFFYTCIKIINNQFFGNTAYFFQWLSQEY